MRLIEITELNSGKKHYMKLKTDVSITFKVEGCKLVVRDYYTNEKIQSHNVSKYGSISYRAIYKDEEEE